MCSHRVENADRKRQPGHIVYLLSLAAMTMVPYGLLNPVLTFRLAELGESALTISLVIISWGVPISLLAPYYPKILAHLGAKGSIFLGLSLSAISISFLTFSFNPYQMMLAQALGGVGFGMYWVVTEASLLLSTKSNSYAGRILSVYGLMPTLGAFFGSALVHYLGYTGPIPIIVSAVCMSFATASILFVDWPWSDGEETESGTIRISYFWMLPAGFVIALVSGVFESVPWGLLVAFSVLSDIASKEAVLFLNFFFLGQFLLAWPVGNLIDRLPVAKSILLFSITLSITSFMIPLFVGSFYWIIAILMVWGALTNALRPLGLMMMSKRFSFAQIIAANSLFVIFANSGEVFSPPAVGYAMDKFGPVAMPVILGVCALLLIPVLFFVGMRKLGSDT